MSDTFTPTYCEWCGRELHVLYGEQRRVTVTTWQPEDRTVVLCGDLCLWAHVADDERQAKVRRAHDKARTAWFTDRAERALNQR